jgi:hypothetical protein
MTVLKNRKFTVAIHKIAGPDEEWLRPHDHGCDFFSLILRGGYVEAYYKNPRVTLKSPIFRHFGVLSSHILRKEEAHRIAECRPNTVTVFITWNYQDRHPMAFTERGHLLFKDYYGKGYHLEDGAWQDEA